MLVVAPENVRFRASLGKTCSQPGEFLLPAWWRKNGTPIQEMGASKEKFENTVQSGKSTLMKTSVFYLLRRNFY